MSKYKVVSVSDEKVMIDFLELPGRIYEADPNWVAPLESEVRRTLDPHSNPYFTNATLQLFVCYKNDKPSARCVVVINSRHWEKFGEKAAFFGFLEAVKDEESTGRMFDAVERYCRGAGAELIEGPFNPNHYSELGLKIDKFDEAPRFFETYNREYYGKLLEGSGFYRQRLLHTRINTAINDFVLQHYGAVSFPKRSGGFSVRYFNLFNMKAELERIREVYNEAFSDNWHFLPLTREEYSFSAKYLFFITYPKLVVIVENNGEPVGVLQCVLNINPILQPLRGKMKTVNLPKLLLKRRRIKEIMIYAVGIKKGYQGSRVYKLLLDSMCAIALRYSVLSTTWMSDTNVAAIRVSGHLGLRPYKYYAIYEKKI
ncbi:MAG: GNAT family N-acetyltransferase [candidate division WOR-3 bacterium]|nr:MAG: GNAT family N-acetyltransferase [candidate division WOR-3 bacterium]